MANNNSPSTPGSTILSLSEEQVKLMRLAIKHSDVLKPDWELVKAEGGFVSASAASQRWGRLLKVIMGDKGATRTPASKSSASKPKKSRKTALENGNNDLDDGEENMASFETPVAKKKRSAPKELEEDSSAKRVKNEEIESDEQ